VRDPTLLAFMQNPWFPPGTSKGIIDRYLTDQAFHRKLLSRTMSGNRLVQAFGSDMFNRIWWDNVAPKHSEESSGMTAIEATHVERVIQQVKPDMILTFGTLAEQAVLNSLAAEDLLYLPCHHPNARGKSMQDLSDFAIQVIQWCDQWKVEQTINYKYKKFRESIEPEIGCRRRLL
jgi:hypothetical protein